MLRLILLIVIAIPAYRNPDRILFPVEIIHFSELDSGQSIAPFTPLQDPINCDVFYFPVNYILIMFATRCKQVLVELANTSGAFKDIT